MENSCSCDDCKKACSHKPGWFLPGEIEKVADYLNIDLRELFDTKLGVDWWVRFPDDIYVVAPATIEMTPGSEYPGNPRGQCQFYKDGLCSIHPVKPYECKEYHHEDTHGEVKSRHEFVSETWESQQDWIEKLLGREPVSEGWLFSL